MNVLLNNKKEALSLLKKQEGYKRLPYRDSIKRKLTVGYGFNIEDTGLSEAEASAILEIRLKQTEDELADSIALYHELDEVRQIVLVNMAYNMGIDKLLNFHCMLEALKDKNYTKAAEEMLHSLWAKQVPHRAAQLAMIMEKGIL